MRRGRHRVPYELSANADRRMWIVIGVYAAITVVVAWLADLPLGLNSQNWKSQAWMTLLYMAANVIMSVYRVDRKNSLRRTNETLTEMAWVVGLFWLTPWALIVGRVVAAFVAWHFTKMRIQWRIYNAVIYAIVSIVLAKVYLWIAPSSAHDGWRAVMVGVAVWFLNDLIRIGAVSFLNWARYDRPRLDMLLPTLTTSYLRLIACAFGLLIAFALEISPWSLLPVGAVGVLFVIVSTANSRAASLDAGITQISRLSAATADAARPDEVEHELLRSVEAFGRLETVAIAIGGSGPLNDDDTVDDDTVDDDTDDDDTDDDDFGDDDTDDVDTVDDDTGDDGSGDDASITWFGRRRPGLESAIGSSRALVDLASGLPRVTADRKGTAAAWSLDPIRHSYLVVETAEVSADQADLWTTVGHLVDHARLSIDTVYKSRRLTDLAEREYERARRDALTNLPNRLALLAEVSERLAQPDRPPFSLVLIESLGYQESVNVLGQDFGDATVLAFADHLLSLTDADDVDLVAHVAAAQFVILVSAGTARARVVAEQACAGPTDTGSDADGVGHDGTADPFAQRIAIAGIATASDQTLSAPELMRAAGIALDRASHDEQIASYGSTDAEIAERRMSIRLRLGGAIESLHVFPEFQPQISLASGLATGCEVLARWRDSELGDVRPFEFIPVSEQTGQIDRLTLAIAEQAFDAARYWGDANPLNVSINISARSLDSPAFVRALNRLVDEAGRPTSSTTIEITESMLVDRSSMLLALERMRELGYRISIDDFGTGYSALSYLDRLPADEIKIEQSMVHPIAPDNPVSPVVNHLIELCQALGHTVVAEGVEDHYQLHVLRALGCDLGQGYLFSRPLGADAMTTWLAAHRIAHADERDQQPAAVDPTSRT